MGLGEAETAADLGITAEGGRAASGVELERLDDGAYVHATIGSPLYLRIVSRRGGVLGIEDGGGRRWRCLVLPDVGGADGAVIGSVSVCGPSYRMTEEACDRHENALREAAQRISRALGHRPAMTAQ